MTVSHTPTVTPVRRLQRRAAWYRYRLGSLSSRVTDPRRFAEILFRRSGHARPTRFSRSDQQWPLGIVEGAFDLPPRTPQPRIHHLISTSEIDGQFLKSAGAAHSDWIVVTNPHDDIAPDLASLNLGLFFDADAIVMGGWWIANGRMDLSLPPRELGEVELLNGPATPVVFLRHASPHLHDFRLSQNAHLGNLEALLTLLRAGGVIRTLPGLGARSTLPTGAESAEIIQRHLALRGFESQCCEHSRVAGAVDWRLANGQSPHVSVVIPTRNRHDLVQRVCDSITAHTEYPNYSITVVDNSSDDPDTLKWMKHSGYAIVPHPGVFNYSAVVNTGARATLGELVLFLNNDVVLTDPAWLRRLVDIYLVSGGIVSMNLMFDNGTPQHEGVVISPYPNHLLHGSTMASGDRRSWLTTEVAAVSGAVSLVSRALFDELDGLDEQLAVTFNDVDFCLRARRLGYSCVCARDVQATHSEGASRGGLNPPRDMWLFIERWGIFDRYRDPAISAQLRISGGRPYWRRAKKLRAD